MAEDLGTKLTQGIIDCINIKCGSLPFTKIYRGVVDEILADNEYNILFNGNLYNIPTYGNSTYGVGEVVKIVVPLNNFNDAFLLPKGGSGGGGESGVTSVNGKTGDVVLGINDIANLSTLLNSKLDKNGDGSNLTVDFPIADTRENIDSGETMKIILGKIAKYLNDIKDVAFTGDYNDLVNKPTISSGTVETINGTSPITATANSDKSAYTITHDNSGVTAGTYKSVTVDAKGHVTNGTNPTTLSEFGITDAKIDGNTITLGSNTLTPYSPSNPQDIPVTSVNNKTGAVELTKSDIGLGNVENKNSVTIRSEITSKNVTDALGFNPATRDIATETANGLMSSSDKTKLDGVDSGAQVNKIESISVNGTAQTITNKNVDIAIPIKLTDLTNDAGFITKTVNDLTNYYLKSETYSQQEVNNLIASIQKVTIKIVDTLPTTGEENVIYFISKTGSGNDSYDEYMWINNKWELIGTTAVDLSDYYTKEQTDSLLDNKANSSSLQAHIDNKNNPHEVTKSQIGLDNVTNERQYSVNNPPPYPVTSVNGDTGDVVLSATDVGALPITGGTLTGNLTGQYITGTRLQTTATSNHDGDFATLYDGWIYFRTPSEVLSDIGGFASSNITQTLGSSTTKVPSEKAVADAISSAGGGDMLKANYATKSDTIVDEAYKAEQDGDGNVISETYLKKDQFFDAQNDTGNPELKGNLDKLILGKRPDKATGVAVGEHQEIQFDDWDMYSNATIGRHGNHLQIVDQYDQNNSTVILFNESGIQVNAGTTSPYSAAIKNVLAPTEDLDAANKKYVDDAIAASGGGEDKFFDEMADTGNPSLKTNLTALVLPKDEQELRLGSGNSQSFLYHLNDTLAIRNAANGTYNGITVGVSQISLYDSMQGTPLKNVGTPTEDLDAVNKKYVDSNFLSPTGDGSNLTETFTQATTRANINTGETHSTIFGKIKKWFADLKTIAFTGKFSDLTEHPTTLNGYGITDCEIHDGLISIGDNSIEPLTSIPIGGTTIGGVKNGGNVTINSDGTMTASGSGGDYLPLSGGTLTGELTIKSGGLNVQSDNTSLMNTTITGKETIVSPTTGTDFLNLSAYKIEFENSTNNIIPFSLITADDQSFTPNTTMKVAYDLYNNTTITGKSIVIDTDDTKGKFTVTSDSMSFYDVMGYINDLSFANGKLTLNYKPEDQSTYTILIDSVNNKISFTGVAESPEGSVNNYGTIDGVKNPTTTYQVANKAYVDLLSQSVNSALTSLTNEFKSQLADKAPAYQYSTTDLTAGTSSLAEGTLYFVYE
mgnify:CR=1 FL=1